MKWNNLPLRLRLTLLFVGLLAILLVALGTVFHLDTRHFLIANTATRLRAQAKPIIERHVFPSEIDVPGELSQIADELSQSLTSRDTAAVVIDRDGRVLSHGRRLAEEPPHITPDAVRLAEALSGDNEVTYIAQLGTERHLVLLIPLRRLLGSDEIVGAAQLNSPLTQVDETLRSQIVFIALGIFLTLAVGTAGGLFLTGSALRPLRRMAKTCREIAAGDLSRRVALPPQRKDEIGQLADAFDEMVANLEKSFAAQHRFIGNAAHELKTPLAALEGSLEVLLRGAQDDAATARQLTQGLHRETLRLKRLVEQLLDVSRFDAPIALHFERIEIGDFLREFAEQARMLAQDRDIEIDDGKPVLVSVDTDALKQALFNLVDNAVRHTAKNGIITIGWQREAEEVEIWVEDDGEGIAEADLPYIFEPFYRGGNDHSRSRQRGGTGLGLSLVKETVKAHGGRIEVRNKRSAGARFTIIFPASK